jgi:RHS repeat-associated protein
LSTAAGSAPERLTLKARPRKAGYLYVYLSNENPVIAEVFFDDFKIHHVKSPVIQYSEYYPYGMSTSGSWTREYNSNSYLYNQGSESNTNTGWYETMFRDYNPVLGRFMQVDPLAAKYDNWSPYHYAFNDPVFCLPAEASAKEGNDPSGADSRGFSWWSYPNSRVTPRMLEKLEITGARISDELPEIVCCPGKFFKQVWGGDVPGSHPY